MRTSSTRLLVFFGSAAFVLSACGGDDTDSEPADPSSASSLSPSAEPTEPPSTSDALPSEEASVPDSGGESAPDSFLAPPPEASTVRNTTELGDDVIVEFGVPGEQITSGEEYRDLLRAAGFTISNEQQTTSSSGGSGLAFRAEDAAFSMQVTTGTDRFEPDQAIITCSYTVDPA